MNTDATSHATVKYGVLDGWRAVSISLVLCGHLLPLGPKRFEMNEAIAAVGMVIFFVLSGFLIVSFLLRRPDVPAFLIRRFCRIVPLAWLYCAIVLAFANVDVATWLAHLLFFGNLPPFLLIGPTAHIWSLCVEMQFYVGIALVVLVFGRRGLWIIPLSCVAVTMVRVAAGAHMSIVTWLRIDEILAGGTLALLFHGAEKWKRDIRISRLAAPVLALVLLASAHPRAGPLNYLRPYIAASLVGMTLFTPQSSLATFLVRRELAYIAKISYALYVIHGGLANTWLATGDVYVKYAKRPLLVGILFLLAHISTFKFESHWIKLGQRWSDRLQRRPSEPSPPR